MSDRPTQETDAEYKEANDYEPSAFVEPLAKFLAVERERNEAREALADWENAADHVEANHPDEVHCGCVPVLRHLYAPERG